MTEKSMKTVDEYGVERYTDLNGDQHREDGPCLVAGGNKMWCLHGILHREDGPAVEYGDGRKKWYLHGKRLFGDRFEYAHTCPLEELPAYLGTPYECIARKRMEAGK